MKQKVKYGKKYSTEGEKMRDYQYKKIKEYILPEAVYRQALWAARDMGRLMEKLAEARDRLGETVPSNMGYKHNRRLSRSDPTYGQAREMINLALRIEGIERALDTVPADFRKGIRKKFMYDEDYGEEYEETIWKRWQQVFLFYLAINQGIY